MKLVGIKKLAVFLVLLLALSAMSLFSAEPAKAVFTPPAIEREVSAEQFFISMKFPRVDSSYDPFASASEVEVMLHYEDGRSYKGTLSKTNISPRQFLGYVRLISCTV